MNRRMYMNIKDLDINQVIKRLCKKEIKTNQAAKMGSWEELGLYGKIH